ncbi:hypothetical protein F4804DRAFT_330105 [Jackrogersella minutella]|nr:hypothetical protein F4804DRAFT_330105 [Jackrogersella minutella]
MIWTGPPSDKQTNRKWSVAIVRLCLTMSQASLITMGADERQNGLMLHVAWRRHEEVLVIWIFWGCVKLEAKKLRTTRLGPSDRRSLVTRLGGEDVRLHVARLAGHVGQASRKP